MSDQQEKPIRSSTAPARFLLIVGGARSGKSTFAEHLAASSGRSVAFIATATAGDEEMRERIARHRASRPGGWQTIEEPLDLAGAVRRASEVADVLLLDCITLWLSNVLLQEYAQQEQSEHSEVEEFARGRLFDERALQEVEALLGALKEIASDKVLLAVTNEVGLGIVPAYPLGRMYRDTLGYVNQRLAEEAERVYLMVAGIAVDIKRLQEEAAL